MRKILISSLLAAGVIAAASSAVLAEEMHMHNHSDASGTPEAPLDIVRDPSDLPPPVAGDGPRTVKVGLQTTEVTGKLADGASYHYWTFNGKVPGPFIRARVNDTVEVALTNAMDSNESHSVDLHAVIGPGGGAVATNAAPGETKSFSFKATRPGLYVYHCATPMVARHIANGMYGMILVEPQGGLAKVDREFYVMQGEVYTTEPLGTKGLLTESKDKLLAEHPEYVVFNGSASGLKNKPLRAKVGETVRIYFGDGGPNLTSSFHVIGAIFDKVYPFGSIGEAALSSVQTAGVPAGGSAVVEMKFVEPGKYILVDHALSRVERGAAGVFEVDSPADETVFRLN